MNKTQNQKPFDLEERTFNFAKKVRDLLKNTPKTLINIEYIKQLTRSSSSVGANYIEVNEAISKKDFIHRLRISRKEAKESTYWLKLIDFNTNSKLTEESEKLIDEAMQFVKIFGAIISKSE